MSSELGEILVNAGKITPEQAEQALTLSNPRMILPSLLASTSKSEPSGWAMWS